MKRQFAVALIALFVCGYALAACETDMTGHTKEFDVVVSQDCGIRSEITVFKFDKKTRSLAIPYQRAFLDTECKFTKNRSLICFKNGKTILSGAQYKLTADGAPQCPGDSSDYRYTCIKGCTKLVPKHLSIAPYEC
jgi:hypothetical protein